MLYSCKEQSKTDLLSNVAIKYFDAEMNNEETKKFYKEIGVKTFILKVDQKENFEGFEIFNIYFVSSLYDEPNFLSNEKGNIYVAIYLNNNNIKRTKIPHFLKHSNNEFVIESSLLVVYCNDTKNYMLIKLDEGCPIECIKNIKRFKCQGENNSKIEKAIIDWQCVKF